MNMDDIMRMDMGEILTAMGKDFFAKRDDSPGNFFAKFGIIWSRFMNSSEVAEWWQERFGSVLRTDEHSRLRTMPTFEQLLETLLFIQQLQNHWHDTFDTYWTDGKKLETEIAGGIIPQKPTRIDLDFTRGAEALKASESAWTGISFTKLFRGMREQKTYRVSTYMMGLTLWAIWNPEQDKTMTQADALEAIRKQREQSKLNMRKVREEARRLSGFGDHSKQLTHHMLAFKRNEESIAKLDREIESLTNKRHRLQVQQSETLEYLQRELLTPLEHSESQHQKLTDLIRDDESPF